VENQLGSRSEGSEINHLPSRGTMVDEYEVVGLSSAAAGVGVIRIPRQERLDVKVVVIDSRSLARHGDEGGFHIATSRDDRRSNRGMPLARVRIDSKRICDEKDRHDPKKTFE
jgi:hypothetical protein